MATIKPVDSPLPSPQLVAWIAQERGCTAFEVENLFKAGILNITNAEATWLERAAK
jgi:hypothetical protein